MNECLESIAPTYPFVKFCKVRSTEISLSDRFVNIYTHINVYFLPFKVKKVNLTFGKRESYKQKYII